MSQMAPGGGSGSELWRHQLKLCTFTLSYRLFQTGCNAFVEFNFGFL